MSRRPQHYDEFEYEDDDYEHDSKYKVRKLKREKDIFSDKKKKWDRESMYDRDHDYDERR